MHACALSGISAACHPRLSILSMLDMMVFRENSEDIYTGIEFENGTAENHRFKDILQENFPKEYAKIAFRIQRRSVSSRYPKKGHFRLVQAAIQWSLKNKRRSVTSSSQRQYYEVHRGLIPQLGL